MRTSVLFATTFGVILALGCERFPKLSRTESPSEKVPVVDEFSRKLTCYDVARKYAEQKQQDERASGSKGFEVRLIQVCYSPRLETCIAETAGTLPPEKPTGDLVHDMLYSSEFWEVLDVLTLTPLVTNRFNTGRDQDRIRQMNAADAEAARKAESDRIGRYNTKRAALFSDCWSKLERVLPPEPTLPPPMGK